MELPNTPPGMVESPPKGKNKVLKTIAIGCAGVFGVLVLACVGIFGYIAFQQRSLLNSGKENYAAGNFEVAVADLEKLIENYETSEQAAEARELLPQVRLDWAKALREEDKFAESLAQYDAIDSLTLADQVAAGRSETQVDWGETLLAEGQFAEAQTQLEAVLEVGENGPFYERARTALAEVYVGLAEAANDSGDTATAFEHLNYVFTNYESGAGLDKAIASFEQMAPSFYELAQEQRSNAQYADAESPLVAIVNYAPETELAQQVKTEFPAFYMEWGDALAADEKYEDAAYIYEFLIDNFPDSEFTEAANTAMIDARVAAIANSGLAGELPPPQAGASSGEGTAAYDITNDTVCPIEVLMSGPDSQVVRLEANSNTQIEFAPGTYGLVVQIEEADSLSTSCQDVIPFTNQTQFDSGMIYYSSFYIETSVE